MDSWKSLVNREDLSDYEVRQIPSDNATNFLSLINFYEKHGGDLNLLFKGTDYTKGDFLDSTRWLNPYESEKISKNFFIYSPTFLNHKSSYEISLEITKISPLLRSIVKYTPYSILINNVMKTAEKMENSFNYTLEIEGKNSFLFKIEPKPFKKRFLIGHESSGAKGTLDAFFKIKRVKMLNQQTLCYSGRLEKIVSFFYKDHGFSLHGDTIYLNGEVFAVKRSPLLIPALIPLNRWDHNEWVYYVERDYYFEGEEIFREGDIYNAPFSLYKWDIQNYSGVYQKLFDIVSFFKRSLIKDLEEQFEINNSKARSLMQLSARLAEEKKQRSMLLGKIVHEIKSPLANIVMLIDSMGNYESALPDYVNDGFKELSYKSDKLSHFVDNVMSFFSIDNDSFNLKFDEIDIAKLIDDVLDSFSIIPKELKVVSKIEPDSFFIHGDYYRLTQVFFNIIGNSVKFTKEGVIEISAAVNDDFLGVSVKDTGSGIKESELDSIFNCFKSENIGNREGIGLGLYISREIINHHGGRIEVESTYGKGALFRVLLPKSVILNR